MQTSRISYLLHQYANNLATLEEVEELFALIDDVRNDEALTQAIIETMNNETPNNALPDERWKGIWTALRKDTEDPTQKRFVIPMMWLRVAAVVLVVIAAGGFYFTQSLHSQPSIAGQTATTKSVNDVKPGGNKAILTLADGTSIRLDSAQAGALALQGNTHIIKKAEGELVYAARGANNRQALYNTVTTPAGGKYNLVLPDGSKVWLNASSSLHFPAAFDGRERRVELTGEAYFEVAKDAARPFRVKAAGADVQVLGTHFNVMAYPDEKIISTTLLEGKVRISDRIAVKELNPGMQAVIDKQTQNIRISNVNTEQSVAWKNDVFRFKDTNIRELMRQARRWYNVEVEFEPGTEALSFTGIVPRTENVSALLQMLELTGTVHFRIVQSADEGKAGKIIVMP